MVEGFNLACCYCYCSFEHYLQNRQYFDERGQDLDKLGFVIDMKVSSPGSSGSMYRGGDCALCPQVEQDGRTTLYKEQVQIYYTFVKPP